MADEGVTARRRAAPAEEDREADYDWNTPGDSEGGGIVSRRGNAPSEGLTRRMRGGDPTDTSQKRTSDDDEDVENAYEGEEDTDNKETRLTLIEELLLLGLKDREGYTSFWNEYLSSGLRGAILIELALKGRIGLEPAGMRRRSLMFRKVVLLNDRVVGDVLCDETLKHIKENEPATVKSWIEYLSGETWNPMKLRLQLRNVRQRIAKNLTEKGVCTTEKQNYVVFDMTTHPVVDGQVKQRLLRRAQDGLLSRWTNDPQRWEKRLLALITLAQASDVLENALNSLNDEDYDLATKRVHELMELDFDAESLKEGTCEVLWAVLAAFNS